MALLTCPECGHKVSDKAEICPECGYPVSSMTTILTTNQMKEETQQYNSAQDTEEGRPSSDFAPESLPDTDVYSNAQEMSENIPDALQESINGPLNESGNSSSQNINAEVPDTSNFAAYKSDENADINRTPEDNSSEDILENLEDLPDAVQEPLQEEVLSENSERNPDPLANSGYYDFTDLSDSPDAASGTHSKKKLKIILCAVLALVLVVIGILFGTKTLCIHKWQDATCTEPITCSRCGRTQGEAIGHDWQDATCTEPVTCANCGETKGDALGHNWVDATCTEAKMCSRCGETEGVALGHDWQDATCTEAKSCSVCGATEGEALGHDWQDATCTEPKTCSRCEKTEGNALGHNPDKWVTVTEATCSEEGKETAKCKRCGEELEETIPMLEHTPGEWTITTKATYSEAGEKTQYCTVCGAVLGTEEYELSATEKESYFKALCQGYSYDTIARDPDSYVGKYAYFKGEVIQVLEDGDDVTLRVNVTNEGYYWDDTIMISYTRKDGESDM